uniref:Uncharacterized protein n=1 Tax=Lepeophtheirus salmonis TaxID=72036 RepID=A0A0K2TZV2_LEPSM
MSTVSFPKHLMGLRSVFLKLVTENQGCPHIVVCRHKIRHFYELKKCVVE